MKASNFEQVIQWHLLAGIKPPVGYNVDDTLALKLILEEVGELQAALKDKNVAEVADALGDILFVAYGACYRYGMDANIIFNEVSRSNFSKFCLTEEEALDTIATYNKEKGADFAGYRQEGNYYVVFRLSDGKLLKSKKWSPPMFDR
jgi:NTP pyrophosphatase (non-canonical NTP hydrolase)